MTTPSQELTSQHRRCDHEYAALEAALRAARWPEAETALKAFSDDVLGHLSLEEGVIFPAFEKATGIVNGPTRVMRMEHEDMRDLIAQIEDAVAARDAGAALSAGETLLVLTQQHNMKEESILYPMCERTVPDLAERMAAEAR